MLQRMIDTTNTNDGWLTMKTTYDVNQLADMKSQFIAWLEEHWCECVKQKRDDLATDPDDDYWDDDGCEKRVDGHSCHCYGRDEYDEVLAAVHDDDAGIVICYGDRTLNLPFNKQPLPDNNDCLPLFNRVVAGELFIECDDMTWVGDDVDYYGPIVYFIQSLHETS